MRLIKPIIIIVLCIAFSTSCRKNDDTEDSSKKDLKQLYNDMNQWYLWYKYMPSINYEDYTSLEDLLDDLMYKKLDRWSFIIEDEAYYKYYAGGELSGYGFLPVLDENLDIVVAYTDSKSPMRDNGITRGCKLTKVGSYNVSYPVDEEIFNEELSKKSNTFSFIMKDGTSKSVSVSQGYYEVDKVFYKSIIKTTKGNVGYLVFNSFVDDAIIELEEAFNMFNANNVVDVVLDLRYNSGGSLEIANSLASMISNNKYFGDLLYKLSYNDKVAAYNNKSVTFPNVSVGLNIERLFVITTFVTASASEALITGLEPYMDIYQIGGYTDGKYVGMNSWQVGDYFVFPITFKFTNSEGYTDFVYGLQPDCLMYDGLDKELGDTTERSLNQAIKFIENGFFTNNLFSVKSNVDDKFIKGYNSFVGRY